MNLNQGESEDKFREYLFDENNKLMIKSKENEKNN